VYWRRFGPVTEKDKPMMHKHALTMAAMLCCGLAGCACAATPPDLKEWQTEGDVSLDPGRSHAENLPSLKVGPGGKAVKPLRDQDGSGRVSLWIYDDKSAPADPKTKRAGPRWGVMQSNGTPLIVGILYAPYLGGDTGYASSDIAQQPYNQVQWLSVRRDEAGWKKWDFVFDPEKGATILVNDKPIKNFDWNKTQVGGFSGVVIYGDEAKGPAPQTIWAADIQAELGGPMKVKVAPPPPPLPILPEKDPAAETPPVKFLDAVAGKHPRLLLNAERLPQLREFFNSEGAKLYREQMLGFLPGCALPQDRKLDIAWGQEAGLQKLPTAALHYVLTGDKASLERSVAFLKWVAATANWTVGGEPAVPDTAEAYTQVLEKMKKMGPAAENNSDTTAAFTMVGAALTWDWLYNDLDPAFREQFRRILWEHARAMYYGGHLGANPGGNYWRGVPMYNHRWFRDWGLALAALATGEGKPEEQWLLGKIEAELQFMAAWLPPDGSQHEGPGYGSSSGALGMTFQANDECLGTRMLDKPFFKNVAFFSLQESAPGMKEAFYFADCFDKALSVHSFYLKTASRERRLDELDGIRKYLVKAAAKWGSKESAWLALLCDAPALQGGDFTKLPQTAFFPDLGLTILREDWSDQAVAALFKCGVPGGITLNSWRPVAKTADGKLPYINVAHDHPDANSFTIWADGNYVAETNRYPLGPGKLSTGNNTILINGLGQVPDGRSEGDDWWQPSGSDMTGMARITAWKDAGEVVIAEGEAAGSYLPYTDNKSKRSRPALDRFRRTFVWVKGGYILALDDIRAPKPVEVTWLMQGAKLEPLDEKQGKYRLSKEASQCEFQLLSDAALTAKIGVSTANNHKKLMNWQQLQASAEGQAVRFASIYDPWHRKDLKLAFTPEGADKATLTVSGNGIHDTWTWQAAAGRFAAATLHGVRQGGFDVTVDAKTGAPANE